MKKIIIPLLLLLSIFIQFNQDKIDFFRLYKIDFFLIYAVILPLFFNGIFPLFLSLLGGIFQDSLTGGIIGLNAISKFTISYLILLLSKYVNLQIKILLFPIFIFACLLDFTIVIIVSKWFNLNLSFPILTTMIIKYIINSAIGYIFLIVLKKLTFKIS